MSVICSVFGAQFVPEKGVDEAVTCAADGLVRHTILARGDTELNPSRNGTSRVLVEHDDMVLHTSDNMSMPLTMHIMMMLLLPFKCIFTYLRRSELCSILVFQHVCTLLVEMV